MNIPVILSLVIATDALVAVLRWGGILLLLTALILVVLFLPAHFWLVGNNLTHYSLSVRFLLNRVRSLIVDSATAEELMHLVLWGSHHSIVWGNIIVV